MIIVTTGGSEGTRGVTSYPEATNFELDEVGNLWIQEGDDAVGAHFRGTWTAVRIEKEEA